jgi:hypothetical protein
MSNSLRNKLAASKNVVCEAYQNGATLREIAEIHSVSAGTVRNTLKECGVEMRSRGRRKAVKEADTRLLHPQDSSTFDTLDGHTPAFVQLETVDPTPAVQE